jgi:predicted nucleic acid-binding protein
VAVTGWIVDNSVEARKNEPVIRALLDEIADPLYVCPVGELERLYSARSAREYDAYTSFFRENFMRVDAPFDIFDRALRLQRDLAHHHGLWHRIPIPDLLIAETALHHDLGVVHVDGDFERIAEVRPLVTRRLGSG